MPFYEIQHSLPLSFLQKAHLAKSITSLHSKTFNAPSLFVNIKFTDIKNESYFIGGQLRSDGNWIFAHVRSGRTRTVDVLATLAKEVEGLWYEALGKGDMKRGEGDLSAVFIVPGLVAREKGVAIPEVCIVVFFGREKLIMI